MGDPERLEAGPCGPKFRSAGSLPAPRPTHAGGGVGQLAQREGQQQQGAEHLR
eukprot:gene2422-1524_t